MKYNLAIDNWTNQEVNIVTKLLKQRKLTLGDNVYNFEKEFAKFHSTKYAVMVNSGSSANHLIFSALMLSSKFNLKEGDEVIVPSLGWSTTYSPLFFHNLKIKLIDIDLNNLNIDSDLIEKNITLKTKAIFLVNALGNPNKFDKIRKIAKKNKIFIIEDNCEAFGASFNDKLTGSFGIMSSFSFYYSHHLTTIEGGMILTDNKDLYNILLSIRSHGWTRHLQNINDSEYKKFKNSFDFIYPGYNFRPMEISGAIGLIQLKKANSIIKTRRNNAKYFKNLFMKQSDFIVQEEIGKSSWFNFSLIIKNTKKYPLKKTIEALNKNNIECRKVIGGDFISQKYSKFFNKNNDKFVNSKIVHQNGFMVGNYDKDLKSEINYLYKTLFN